MTVQQNIIKQEQILARCEKSLALEKVKKRRADTRRKIELGGLIIKAGMAEWDKFILLGALDYSRKLLKQDEFKNLFQITGQHLFSENTGKNHAQ